MGREKEAGVPPRNKAAIHVWRLVINISCYKIPPLRPLDAAIAQTPAHRPGPLYREGGRQIKRDCYLTRSVGLPARTLNSKKIL